MNDQQPGTGRIIVALFAELALLAEPSQKHPYVVQINLFFSFFFFLALLPTPSPSSMLKILPTLNGFGVEKICCQRYPWARIETLLIRILPKQFV